MPRFDLSHVICEPGSLSGWGNWESAFLHPTLDVGTNVTLTLRDGEGGLTSVEASEVFFNGELLAKESHESTRTSVLEAGDELRRPRWVLVLDVSAIGGEIGFGECSHDFLSLFIVILYHV